MKRYLIGLLIAYAASITLLASHWVVERAVYRRCFDLLLMGKHGHPVEYHDLRAIVADFGLSLRPWEYWALTLADLRGALLVPAILSFFAAGLILPAYLTRRAQGV